MVAFYIFNIIFHFYFHFFKIRHRFKKIHTIHILLIKIQQIFVEGQYGSTCAVWLKSFKNISNSKKEHSMMEIYRILERTIWFTPYCILIWVCYTANCLWFKFLQSLWNRKKYQPLMKTEHNPWKEHYWLNCNAPYSVFNKYSLKGQYGSNHNVPDTVFLKNV